MMINKQSNKDESPDPKEEGPVEIAYMDVQCHLIIKDKDTSETLVNQRG